MERVLLVASAGTAIHATCTWIASRKPGLPRIIGGLYWGAAVGLCAVGVVSAATIGLPLFVPIPNS